MPYCRQISLHVFNMSRCVIEGMRERGFGRIVNIGSVNGQAGQYGQVNYSAAKSRHTWVYQSFGKGRGRQKEITVNAIAPGYVDTDMVRAVPEKVLEKNYSYDSQSEDWAELKILPEA